MCQNLYTPMDTKAAASSGVLGSASTHAGVSVVPAIVFPYRVGSRGLDRLRLPLPEEGWTMDLSEGLSGARESVNGLVVLITSR